MANARTTIDNYLGSGTYRIWELLERQTEEERERYYRYEPYLSQLDSSLTGYFADDIAMLEKLSSDYGEAMDLVIHGWRVARAEIVSAYDMYSLTVGLVEHNNNILERLVRSGALRALAAIPFDLLDRRLAQLQRELAALKKEWEKYRQQVREVWVQLGADIVLEAISLLPGVGLGGKLFIWGTQFILDEILGGEKSPVMSTVDDIGDRAEPGVEILEEATKLGSRANKVAKKGGKFLTITGFVADIDELREAQANVSAIEAKQAAAQKSYEALIEWFHKHRKSIKRLWVLLRMCQLHTEDDRQMAETLREQLGELLRATAYPLDRQKIWTIQQAAAAR